MVEVLKTPALTVLGLILVVILIVLLTSSAYFMLRRRHRKELQRVHDQFNPGHFRALHDHLQGIVAHEFVKGLNYISSKGEETLQGLDQNEIVLREKQANIVAKSFELIQHADNVVGLFALQRVEVKRELIRPRQVVEDVLVNLFPYAESTKVTIQHELEDLEPISVNRHFVVQILTNLIHNAIKYSQTSSVVMVSINLLEDFRGLGKAIDVQVVDQGIGIKLEDHERIFELQNRSDGLIQPGSGLGLNYARTLARLHSGDVILSKSNLNQGSTFNLIIPYGSP